VRSKLSASEASLAEKRRAHLLRKRRGKEGRRRERKGGKNGRKAVRRLNSVILIFLLPHRCPVAKREGEEEEERGGGEKGRDGSLQRHYSHFFAPFSPRSKEKREGRG